MTPEQKTFEHVKELADVGAGAVTVATIMNWAPAIAAVFTALYAGFRLYEIVDRHFQDRKKQKRWPYKDK